MKTLYVGLDPPSAGESGTIVHCPLIQVLPRHTPEVLSSCRDLGRYTHLLFTSKSAVRFFLEIVEGDVRHLQVLSLGAATTRFLLARGLQVHHTAEDETSEGVVAMLERLDLRHAHLLWPHAVRSRAVISDALRLRRIPYTECMLYDTFPVVPAPAPDLRDFDQVVLTSPSTVEAFFALYPNPPQKLRLVAIGPITGAALSRSGMKETERESRPSLATRP